jgi:hypothetical protein
MELRLWGVKMVTAMSYGGDINNHSYKSKVRWGYMELISGK